MNRSEKAALIAQIKAKADAASFVVVTDFKGMTVEELTRLRAKLYECGGYLVVKNTLARIALTDGMHDSVKDMFKENCGIALTSQDPVAVAKAVSEFAKTSKLFTVRHASLEGKMLSAAQVDALAKLPGKQELLGRSPCRAAFEGSVAGPGPRHHERRAYQFRLPVRQHGSSSYVRPQGDRREKGCLGNPLNTQAKVSKEQSHGRYQRRSC